jgi:hypothetical protein
MNGVIYFVPLGGDPEHPIVLTSAGVNTAGVLPGGVESTANVAAVRTRDVTATTGLSNVTDAALGFGAPATTQQVADTVNQQQNESGGGESGGRG